MGYTQQLLNDVRAQLAPDDAVIKEARARRDLHDQQGSRSTGLDIETPWRAATGYVLRCDAWERGLATEVTVAMTRLAEDLRVIRLHALCHPDNTASARVAKTGFLREGVLRRQTWFPNVGLDVPQDVEIWARIAG